MFGHGVKGEGGAAAEAETDTGSTREEEAEGEATEAVEGTPAPATGEAPPPISDLFQDDWFQDLLELGASQQGGSQQNVDAGLDEEQAQLWTDPELLEVLAAMEDEELGSGARALAPGALAAVVLACCALFMY